MCVLRVSCERPVSQKRMSYDLPFAVLVVEVSSPGVVASVSLFFEALPVKPCRMGGRFLSGR